MFSNERPSPYGRQAYHAQGYQQTVRPQVSEDTLKSADLQVERKNFRFSLKENARGRFLRITEDAGGKFSTIIIPFYGLDDFKRLVSEMAKAATAMPGPKPDEQPGDSIGNR